MSGSPWGSPQAHDQLPVHFEGPVLLALAELGDRLDGIVGFQAAVRRTTSSIPGSSTELES